jgi:hypothetical protein
MAVFFPSDDSRRNLTSGINVFQDHDNNPRPPLAARQSRANTDEQFLRLQKIHPRPGSGTVT